MSAHTLKRLLRVNDVTRYRKIPAASGNSHAVDDVIEEIRAQHAPDPGSAQEKGGEDEPKKSEVKDVADTGEHHNADTTDFGSLTRFRNSLHPIDFSSFLTVD